MKDELLAKVRQLQMILTVIVFVLVTIICWNTTHYNMFNYELSKWGVIHKTSWLWNSTLIFVAIGLFSNVFYWITKHPRLKKKRLFYILFGSTTIALLCVGIFPMNYGSLHDFLAFGYFLTYPLFIFILAFVNRKIMNYYEWLKHVILSIAMIVIPISLVTVYYGLAVSEISHSIVVIIWNLSLLKKIKK